MNNLAYSIFQDIAETDTQKDEQDFFSIIQPSEKEVSKTNIILGSTAGAIFVDSLSVGFSSTLVTLSSGSQMKELDATGVYVDKPLSGEFGIVATHSVVLASMILETEARNETAEIFSFADGYLQHDGISDILYSKIEGLFSKYGDLATKFIKELFDEHNVNSEVIDDSLAIIGDLTHVETASSRLKLLEHYLFSSSHYIRDGAIIGIANLNDSSAIKSLKLAAKNEELNEIRSDIQKTILLLEKYGTPFRD